MPGILSGAVLSVPAGATALSIPGTYPETFGVLAIPNWMAEVTAVSSPTNVTLQWDLPAPAGATMTLVVSELDT